VQTKGTNVLKIIIGPIFWVKKADARQHSGHCGTIQFAVLSHLDHSEAVAWLKQASSSQGGQDRCVSCSLGSTHFHSDFLLLPSCVTSFESRSIAPPNGSFAFFFLTILASWNSSPGTYASCKRWMASRAPSRKLCH